MKEHMPNQKNGYNRYLRLFINKNNVRLFILMLFLFNSLDLIAQIACTCNEYGTDNVVTKVVVLHGPLIPKMIDCISPRTTVSFDGQNSAGSIKCYNDVNAFNSVDIYVVGETARDGDPCSEERFYINTRNEERGVMHSINLGNYYGTIQYYITPIKPIKLNLNPLTLLAGNKVHIQVEKHEIASKTYEVQIKPNGQGWISLGIMTGTELDITVPSNTPAGRLDVRVRTVNPSGSEEVKYSCWVSSNIDVLPNPNVEVQIKQPECYGAKTELGLIAKNISTDFRFEFHVTNTANNNIEVIQVITLSPNKYYYYDADLGTGNYRCEVFQKLPQPGGGESNSFVKEHNFTVNHPPQLRILSTTVENAKCTGDSNGKITINASGGTGAINYSLTQNTGYTASNIISNLAPASYTVWVQDRNGCRANRAETVGVSQNITISSVVPTPEKCQNSKDGIIVITASGSNTPFQYSVDNGATYKTSNTFNNLAPKAYTIRVKDNNGCSISNGNTTVVAANPIVISSVPFTNVTGCFGDKNATITINASGGKGTLKYYLNNVLYPSSRITGLGTGSYTVKVVDANGCEKLWTSNIIITSPNVLAVTAVNKVNVTGCSSNANGQITITATGGTKPYTYSINGGSTYQSSNVFGSLIKDINYNVVVRDSKGCTAQFSTNPVKLTGPAAITFNITSKNVVGCSYSNNGQIIINASGGTGALMYSISGNTNYTSSNTFNNLPAGSYSVWVKDQNNCTSSANRVINGPDPIIIDPVDQPDVIQCYGENTGEIYVTASGGAGALTYSVDGGNTYQSNGWFRNLYAGNYTIRVKDANNCFVNSSSISIQQKPKLEVSSLEVTDVLCNGGGNGSIMINGKGGTGSIKYSITGDFYYDENFFEALDPGEYNIFLSDDLWCTSEYTNNPVIISEPAIMEFTDTVFVMPTCTNKGDVTVKVKGGTPSAYGYDFILTNEEDNSTTHIQGFEAFFKDAIDYTNTLYSIEVLDANSCNVNPGGVDWVITAKAGPPIQVESSTTINPSCYGWSDGSISIDNVSGGSGTYVNYEWTRVKSGENNVLLNGQTISNLSQGVYFLTITDSEGCTSIKTGINFWVENPPELDVNATITPTKCFGDANGIIEIKNIINGVPDYTYKWKDSTGTGVVDINSNIQNKLSSGIFNVTVSDSKGCNVKKHYTVNQPAKLKAGIVADNNFNSYNVKCFGDLGSATANAVGGVGGYTYNWSNNIKINKSANLDPGVTYKVTVLDNNYCTDIASIVLTEPTELTSVILPDFTYEGKYNVKCFGDKGTATAFPTGGIAPYNYTWENGNDTKNAINLNPDTKYSVIIADANNCADTSYISLQQPEKIVAIAIPDNNFNGYDVECFGSQGTATASGKGGVKPYLFNWSNGEITATATLQSEIENTVTVTDKYSCNDNTRITLKSPKKLNASVLPSNSYSGYDVKCYGDLGSATAYGVDGVEPYTFQWSNGQTTAEANSLKPGVQYSVSVTDANGCTATGKIILTQPDSIFFNDVDITHVICKGGNNASIDISPIGGVKAYSYLWSTSNGNGLTINNEDQQNLTTGNYTVILSDAHSCTYTESFEVNEPAKELVIEITEQTNINCNAYYTGAVKLNTTGGWGSNYTYSKNSNFNFNNTFTNLPAGQIKFYVKDEGGCIDTILAEIIQPDEITANIIITNEISYYGAKDGAFQVNTTGGTAPYLYSIDNGVSIQSSNEFSGFGKGQYTVLIIDANDCTQEIEASLTQPDPIELAIVNTINPTCGNDNGSITVSASAGTPPYTYAWPAKSQTGVTLSNVGAGNYDVEVTDSKGGMFSFTVSLYNSDGPIAEIVDVKDATCHSSSDGSATINIISGINPVQIKWSDPLNQTGNSAVGLSPGNYIVSLTDGNNCVNEYPVTVGLENELSIEFIATKVSCKNGSNAKATAVVSNGTWPYTYRWTDEDGNELGLNNTITNLKAGKYIVEVWDANLCPNGPGNPGIKDTVVIKEPFQAIELSIVDKQDSKCYGESTGQVLLNAIGGWGEYEYSGDNINFSNNSLYSNLSIGNKTFYAKDQLGCITSAEATINQPVQISLNFTNVKDVVCNGLSNGSFLANASGGIKPYVYKLEQGGSYVSSNDFYNLIASQYTLYVKDANNCEFSESIQINQPSVLGASEVNNTNNTCGNSNGRATIKGLGGVSPYTYLWNDINSQTEATANGLKQGVYNVTLTDAHNCKYNHTVEIKETPGPELILEKINSISCAGIADGGAELSVNKGTAPFTVKWNDYLSQSGLNATHLATGNYTVTVSDVNNCTNLLNINIPDIKPLALILDNKINPNCYGRRGSLDISVTGGIQPYIYNWSNGGTGAGVNNLDDGQYDLLVTDAHNCIINGSYRVTGPPGVAVALGRIADTLCQGQSITLNAGHPDMIHLWTSDNGFNSTDQIIEVSTAGTYNVKVTNSFGCSGTASFKLVMLDQVFDAGILLTDIGYVGDTLVVCELTWPIPERIKWDIPYEFTVIDEDRDHIYLVPNKVGLYTIGLNVYYDACNEYIYNNIEILPASKKELARIFGEMDAEEFNILLNLYPNPSDGVFKLAVKLNEAADVVIEMFDLTGTPFLTKQDKGNSEYLFDFDLTRIKSGYYFIIVRSGDHRETIRFIKM